MMGLGIALNILKSPSSRNYESGVLQGLYILELEVAWILRGAM
jgi:hypothetical protein